MQDNKTNIGQLRQWLNEDRITDPKKMVTNEELEHWLEKDHICVTAFVDDDRCMICGDLVENIK